MIFFGLVGYLLRKFKYELSPLIMAFVLGPMLEEALRQSLIMSRGSFDIFISRPLSLAFLIVAAITALSRSRPSSEDSTLTRVVYGRKRNDGSVKNNY